MAFQSIWITINDISGIGEEYNVIYTALMKISLDHL